MTNCPEHKEKRKAQQQTNPSAELSKQMSKNVILKTLLSHQLHIHQLLQIPSLLFDLSLTLISITLSLLVIITLLYSSLLNKITLATTPACGVTFESYSFRWMPYIHHIYYATSTCVNNVSVKILWNNQTRSTYFLSPCMGASWLSHLACKMMVKWTTSQY